jgi:hypothetical protein
MKIRTASFVTGHVAHATIFQRLTTSSYFDVAYKKTSPQNRLDVRILSEPNVKESSPCLNAQATKASSRTYEVLSSKVPFAFPVRVLRCLPFLDLLLYSGSFREANSNNHRLRVLSKFSEHTLSSTKSDRPLKVLHSFCHRDFRSRQSDRRQHTSIPRWRRQNRRAVQQSRGSPNVLRRLPMC